MIDPIKLRKCQALREFMASEAWDMMKKDLEDDYRQGILAASGEAEVIGLWQEYQVLQKLFGKLLSLANEAAMFKKKSGD